MCVSMCACTRVYVSALVDGWSMCGMLSYPCTPICLYSQIILFHFHTSEERNLYLKNSMHTTLSVLAPSCAIVHTIHTRIIYCIQMVWYNHTLCCPLY